MTSVYILEVLFALFVIVYVVDLVSRFKKTKDQNAFHSSATLKNNFAGAYVENPNAIREHYPVEVYHKRLGYWDSTWIEIYRGETCIWACDGVDDITDDLEIYLSTNPERIKHYEEKYVEAKKVKGA